MGLIAILFISACSKVGTAFLNNSAKTNDYTLTSDVVYGQHPLNKLDIYRPRASQNKYLKPVIVFFYGGCWGQCNTLNKSDFRFVAQSFASRGYVTVIPEFRQYPQVDFKEIMSDASRAIIWVDKNISKYGGNTSRLIFMGHSSGAYIASLLSLDSRYVESKIRRNLRGYVGLAGPYDFLPFDEAYQRTLFAPPQRFSDSQPINFVSSKSPPLLILHGEKDTTVNKNNAVSLAQKAQRVGLTHRLILYPEKSHVGLLLALSRPLQNRSSVLRDILSFIQQQTQ